MSSNIEYLIQLHRDGVITNNDLKKGIRALNLPDESSSKPTEQKVSALENLRKKCRDKKMHQKQRRATVSEEATAKASEEMQSEEYAKVSQNLKLINKPLCSYFKTYEIDAHKYKNTSILFVNKKSIIIG